MNFFEIIQEIDKKKIDEGFMDLVKKPFQDMKQGYTSQIEKNFFQHLQFYVPQFLRSLENLKVVLNMQKPEISQDNQELLQKVKEVAGLFDPIHKSDLVKQLHELNRIARGQHVNFTTVPQGGVGQGDPKQADANPEAPNPQEINKEVQDVINNSPQFAKTPQRDLQNISKNITEIALIYKKLKLPNDIKQITNKLLSKGNAKDLVKTTEAMRSRLFTTWYIITQTFKNKVDMEEIKSSRIINDLENYAKQQNKGVWTIYQDVIKNMTEKKTPLTLENLSSAIKALSTPTNPMTTPPSPRTTTTPPGTTTTPPTT